MRSRLPTRSAVAALTRRTFDSRPLQPGARPERGCGRAGGRGLAGAATGSACHGVSEGPPQRGPVGERFFSRACQDEDGIRESPGTGLVEVAPDLGVARLAVITEAETAAEAVQQNATRMQQVLAAVQALPHREIETVGLGVRPITTWDPDTRT